MSLDLTNSNQLDDDFSNYVIVGVGTINRNKPYAKNIIPNRLPSGDRLEDEFGGSARYPRFSEMNDFRDGIPAKIASVGDTDYEYTPYGYNTDRVYEKPEIFANSTGNSSDRKKTRKEKKESRKKRRKDIKEGNLDSKSRHSIAKFNPALATMRGSMISVIQLNVLGMADALNDMKQTGTPRWEQLKTKWYNWGGSKKMWEKAVSKGKGKKPKFKNILEKHKKNNFDGQEYYGAEGKGMQDASKAILYTSAGLAVITPILALIPATQPASVYTGSAGAGFGAMGGIFKGFAKDSGLSDEDVNKIPETADIPEPPAPTDEKQLEKVADDAERSDDEGNIVEGDTILGIPQTAFYIGLGAIALVGGFLIYKKLIAKK